jgi:Cys-rich repeat protein
MRAPSSLMPRARSWAYAGLLLAWCAACDLDPIAKHDLCGGPGPISANCTQCRQPPYAASCPQCVDDPDNGQCDKSSPSTVPGKTGEPSETTITSPGEVSGGSGGSGQSGQPSTSGGSGARPSQTPTGSGAGAISGGSSGIGGAVTPPPSGGTAADSGTKPPPGECRTDGDCSGDTPGCNMASLHCVPCTTDAHCSDGRVCDTGAAQCVECIVRDGCGPEMACDVPQRNCVQCVDDLDCTKDPVNATCSRLHQCVDCEDGHGCAAAMPICNGNTCVECTGDTNCTGERHRCTTDNRCVECLARAGDCAVPGKPVCIEEEQRCVQCIADDDCGEAGASHCVNNQCVGCDSDAQCSHLSVTPVCDTSAQRCVECNKGSNTCGANACVPSTHTCSDVSKRTIETCYTCDSDEQCRSGRCIPMTFSGRNIGNYCLDLKSLVTSQNCQVYHPYSRTLTNAMTIDGDRETVCAPSSSTTCKAVLDAKNSKTCSSAAECGIGMGLIDSTCLPSNRCSYVCSADYDCPDSLSKCGQGGQCSLPGN